MLLFRFKLSIIINMVDYASESKVSKKTVLLVATMISFDQIAREQGSEVAPEIWTG